jgi:hypothetical protein
MGFGDRASKTIRLYKCDDFIESIDDPTLCNNPSEVDKDDWYIGSASE